MRSPFPTYRPVVPTAVCCVWRAGSMGRFYALAVAVAAVLIREAAGVGTRGGAKLVKGGKQRESLYTKEALADEVLTLPGAEALDIKFNQFSGEPIVLRRRFRQEPGA